MFQLYVLGGLALSLFAGYLIGSIAFAVVVSRLMGLTDPRSFGSGNPGATNVLRGGNKLAAVLTLVGDAAKGWAAVALAAWAVQRGYVSEAAVPLAGLGAFLGHIFPLFLRFRGGKGVATALGVLLGLQPWLGVATAATWIIVAMVTRYSSLAAIIAAVFTPFYYVLGDGVAWRADTLVIFTIVVISILLLRRHQKNIGRLLAGKESRIGGKTDASGPATATASAPRRPRREPARRKKK